jgi:malic enzyme
MGRASRGPNATASTSGALSRNESSQSTNKLPVFSGNSICLPLNRAREERTGFLAIPLLLPAREDNADSLKTDYRPSYRGIYITARTPAVSKRFLRNTRSRTFAALSSPTAAASSAAAISAHRELPDDPLYHEWCHPCLRGELHLKFVEEFVHAVKEMFGETTLVQWQDFEMETAFKLPPYFRDKCCSFNDDI